jgi:hypothetical protein
MTGNDETATPEMLSVYEMKSVTASITVAP